MNETHTHQIATLGGGCFWCLEPIFNDLEGVEKVRVGYAGGTVDNPSYRQVCSGTTGHAEVIQVTFQPQVISLREILRVFFTFHDPTTPNRQGADVGPQYRSIILYHSQEQKETAESVITEIDASGMWGALIVTQVAPLEVFYEAEDYHQRYFERNPDQGYCRVVIAPKVLKFRQQYYSRLKSRRASGD
jgi:peptide-methionine (S)-S-oxide reductase